MSKKRLKENKLNEVEVVLSYGIYLCKCKPGAISTLHFFICNASSLSRYFIDPTRS